MAEFDPTTLKDRLESLRGELPYEISTRPMMGGFIGYADGRVFVSMSRGGGFGVKLLPADQELLLGRPGSRRMQHAPNQPESKTYIALSAGGSRGRRRSAGVAAAIRRNGAGQDETPL